METAKTLDISLLECHICQDLPRKLKIFMCSNGHDICETCFNNLPIDGKKHLSTNLANLR